MMIETILTVVLVCQRTQASKLEEAVMAIDRCPSLRSLMVDPLGDEAGQLGSKIESSMEGLTPLPTAVIREALAEVYGRIRFAYRDTPLSKIPDDVKRRLPRVAEEADGAYESRLKSWLADGPEKGVFVNRYVFQVPPREKVSGEPFTAITAATSNGETWDRLAPFRREPDGRLVFIGPVLWNNGAPYDPLDEFDYFASRYPRRRAPARRNTLRVLAVLGGQDHLQGRS